jgi:hypothetical protein
MKTYLGMEVELHAVLASELDEGEWTASRHGRFIAREKIPDTIR